MQEFSPTHRITITHSDGREEHVDVMADLGGAMDQDGFPLYTREEWETFTAADWEFSAETGLTFQGAANPYNNAEYRFRRIES